MEKVPSMYVIGVSRTDSENPITKRYSAFYMAFEVDEAGIVADFGCTHTLAITERFLSKLFLGRGFLQLDDTLERELARRYSGTSPQGDFDRLPGRAQALSGHAGRRMSFNTLLRPV